MHVDTNNCKSFPEEQILTHVIDGFIIEESLSPFPVAANTLTSAQIDFIRRKQQEVLAQEKDVKFADEDNADGETFSMQDSINEDDLVTCEQCGFTGSPSSFSSLRFCSISCARRYAISHSKRSRIASRSRFQTGRRNKRFGHYQTETIEDLSFHSSSVPLHSPSSSVSASSFSECEDSVLSLSDAGSDFTLSPSPSPEVSHTSAQQPLNWSVDDVWKYIRSLPDSLQLADEFRAQEIDGSALLLLHEEHLISSMKLPLGPALKLCAHIDRLRKQESR